MNPSAVLGAILPGRVLPTVEGQVAVDEGSVDVELDPRTQTIRSQSGRVTLGTAYTVTAAVPPSAKDLAGLTADLRTVAASLLKYPNSRIEVIGHTDNTGTVAYNQDLSQRRAVSVAGVLRESGVPGGRLSAYGRGEDQPVASNLTPEGRAQNRRVEIIIRPIQ